MALATHLDYLNRRAERALNILHLYCEAIGARPINPNSTKDVPWLFYEFFGLPPIYTYDRKTKQRKLTTDIKALERIREQYP
ncbi:DNA polymerase, partial [Klebsiella pneumoniae]|nr:DNA polymerase [Klebsiella pneumoniae]